MPTRLTRRSLMASAAAPGLVRAASAPPNLVLILSDDHSVPYTRAYGATWMSTPNLDRFAADGLRFDRAFTAAPQCVPSRVAYLTGRSPVAARVGRFNSPLPADVVSLPEVLRERGYYTGVCGRYFHLDGVIKAGPVTQPIYDKHHLQTWKNRVDFLHVGAQQQTPAQFEQFLSSAPKGKPFFFWINYSDPHHVWDKDAGHVDPAAIRLPPHLPDLPGVRDDLSRYCGEVERMDGLFEQCLGVLKRHSLDENTLVLFAGDNGMAFPHGKGSLYDPGLNVPMIARWPGKVKPGGVTKDLISGEDVTPTFIEAAGGRIPAQMTGRSFLGLLTGSGYEPRKHIFGARLHHGNSPYTADTRAATFDLSRCARGARYKYIYNCTPQMEYWPVDSGKDPGWVEILANHQAGKLKPEHERAYFTRPRPVHELYDLDSDPGELNNLFGQPAVRDVQLELMTALQEKMIIDFDFLPPPLAE